MIEHLRPMQASHQCGPGSIPGLGIMWVEFVVGSCPCSKRFFSGYSGFPFSSKTNISKFQFDLDYCQALYHEPLAREIVQALPMLLTPARGLSLLLVLFPALRGFSPGALVFPSPQKPTLPNSNSISRVSPVSALCLKRRQ